MMKFFDLNFWPIEEKKINKTSYKNNNRIVEKKLGLTPLEYRHSNNFLRNHLIKTDAKNVKLETKIFFEMNYLFRKNEMKFYLPQIFDNNSEEYTGYYMNFSKVRNYFTKIRRLRQD